MKLPLGCTLTRRFDSSLRRTLLLVSGLLLSVACNNPGAAAGDDADDEAPASDGPGALDSAPRPDGTAAPDASNPPDAGDPTPDATGDPTPVGQDESWNLVFHDEFDGTHLDTTRWSACFPWGDATAGCGTDTTPDMWYLPANVIVGDGVVRLRAKRESHEANGRTYDYTSGMISTAGFEGVSSYPYLFQYGYMEMRARMPAGQGLWPAFWTLPPEGAWPPEIDVVEILGDRTNIIEHHYHYEDGDGDHHDYGSNWAGPDTAADFHIFAVAWEPGSIRWYVDGVEREAFESPYVVAEPMYLIANLQVGGSWPGLPDSTTVFPADYVIDYIRVWQK